LQIPHFLLGDVHIDGGRLDRHSIHIWWHNHGTVALFPFEHEVWPTGAPIQSADGAYQHSEYMPQADVSRTSSMRGMAIAAPLVVKHSAIGCVDIPAQSRRNGA